MEFDRKRAVRSAILKSGQALSLFIGAIEGGLQREGTFRSIKLIILRLLVSETPEPLFSQFCGTDHRMTTRFIVTTGVLIFRRIAAQHLAAGLADAQVYPAIVNTHTFLTLEDWIVCFGDQIFQRHLIEMLTRHGI